MGKITSIDPKTIGEVFIEPKHFFEIPRFQRPYSWEEGNIEEFWETIFSPEPVFLGTIILNDRRKKDEGIVEIIDGQQRYLTIQILGAVIRDTCKKLETEYKDPEFGKLAKGVTQSLIGKPDKWDDSKLDNYLTPGESIKSFFLDYIQSTDGNKQIDETLSFTKKSEEELKRIKDAYLKFKELLDDSLQKLISLDEKKSLLKEIVDKRLAEHLFARIVIDDEDLAYEIFETVNAKGVDLNVADLVKNQIFRHVINGDTKYNDGAKELWQTIIENVDAAGLPIKDFLSYYWSSKHGYVADRKLYKAIREHFRNDNPRWIEFLTELVNNSNLLKNIFAGTKEDLETLTGDAKEASKLFESLRLLRNTKAKTWAILYLCIFRNLLSSEFKLDNRWNLIAKFTFVYYEVLNLSGNWYFKEIWTFCKKIEEYAVGKRSNKEFSDLFKNSLFAQFDTKLPKGSPELFHEGFTSISYKDTKKARIIIRYVLSEIEGSLAGQFDTGFDETKVSIEHILPQTPDEWGLSKKEIKDHVNLIGNLVLISGKLNGSLGKQPLQDKIKNLSEKASQMKLVDQLIEKINSDEWKFARISSDKDFEAIEKRGRFLSEIGFKIWVEDLKTKMGF